MSPPPKSTAPPALPLLLLRRLLPRAERDEVLADVAAEYREAVAEHGRRHADRWLWQQALSSAPSLLRWTWWRETSGFESPANNYRPGGPVLRHMFTDFRIAARRLVARPAYSVLAIVTLALGIGGTTAVFGIARPLLFDALPYANEQSVVSFWFGGAWTEQEFVYLRGKFPGYQRVAAFRSNDVTLRNDEAPARLIGGIASSSELLDVLGAKPIMGRGFKNGDDATGAEPVVILSYGLWQELGANQAIVGSRLTLDGKPRTVVGVMPRGFWFPRPSVRVWFPQTLNPEGQNGSYELVGQVAPGQDVQHMGPQVAALVKIMSERFTYASDWDKTKNAAVKPIREELLGEMRPALVATFVAMGLILFIACTNLAALMLGQLESRASELAVRSALGANRRRLTQPLVVEALLIGIVAGTVGAAIAAASFGTLARALPLGAFGEAAAFDWSLYAAAMIFAILSVLVVVLVPSASLFRRGQANLQSVLSQARTNGVRGGGRIERGLVVAEVALAMLIASSSALLVRSVTNLYAVDPGFRANGVAVVDVVVSGGAIPAQRRAAYDELLASFSAMPGVKSVAYSMRLPLRGNSNSFGITVEGREGAERSSTFFRIVSKDYFDAMGFRVLSGRVFESTDRPDSAEALVVINEALAKKYFPNQDPIGHRLGGGFNVPQRIIGVVANVAEGELLDQAKPARYFLASQVWFGNAASFVVKTTRPEQAEAMIEQLRSTVSTKTPVLAVAGITTLSRIFDTAVGPARQIMILLTLLSVLALVLGGVGTYGVISHFATRRKRDWAIRLALGLPSSRVVLHIVAQGAVLIALGVAVGGLATASFSHLLRSMLFGVQSVDLLAFAGASATVLFTGLLAAFIPARRAGAVDPALLLREQ